MTALQCIRVFDTRQGLPTQGLHTPISLPVLENNSKQTFIAGLTGYGKAIALTFESAMYPNAPPEKLSAYELHLDPTTRSDLFSVIKPTHLHTLRLSGDCQIPDSSDTPALRHLILHSLTAPKFDRKFETSFTGCHLESFTYSMGDKLGFEMRDNHLKSLVTGIGKHLRKLVLLGCTRLSSTALSDCLAELPKLEHLALDLITSNELRSNFIPFLPPDLRVFKIQIRNAWFALPLLKEELVLCDAIETSLLQREPRPDVVCALFRKNILSETSRFERWRAIADDRGIDLRLGAWKNDEDNFLQ